ncbi:hypothetical protein M408DRAFT_29179 [Serendipita vermifera MAFF 305830]|uniref:Uncharacterized protein n=1 Tax=Serendipita vermifera MAFF 305830 TaxID=933852 RepID=A0A0C3ARE8_SERVB|nr:hypothetical protein M408DRAFT_29179 [Serendipita vermifera MAFF 305830]
MRKRVSTHHPRKRLVWMREAILPISLLPLPPAALLFARSSLRREVAALDKSALRSVDRCP